MSTVTSIVKNHFLRIDEDGRRVFFGSTRLSLRNKEFALLNFFIKNRGRVLSRTQILEEVWDRNIFCTTNTVDVHVSSIRKKLGRFSGRKIIRTVPCIGYIFESETMASY